MCNVAIIEISSYYAKQKIMFFKKLLVLFFISYNSCVYAVCQTNVINDIEHYLHNNLNNIVLNFDQVSTEGLKNSGLLIIQKPNFRVNYESPHPLVIAGGKNYVSLYDYELEELTRVGAKENIFKFLLEEDIHLQESVKIINCAIQHGVISIFVKHNETEQTAIIEFNERPFKINALVVPHDGVDIDNGYAKITFFDSYEIKKLLGKEFFSIKNPEIYGIPIRYNNAEIMKLIRAEGSAN